MRESFFLELGRTDYTEAHALQLRLVQARKKGDLEKDLFISLEHGPVFTLGRRGGRENLRVPEDFLRSRGIAVIHVERGGDITYHGPGQLVLYPILDLGGARLGVADHVTALEEVMIRTAAAWGITAERNPLNRGVWVGPRKLGSIGIAVRHGISFHGLALNVNTSLEHFGWIHPCGLQGTSVTTMAQILQNTLPMEDVRRSLVTAVEDVFGTTLVPLQLEHVLQRLSQAPACSKPQSEAA